jgi:hypothetical protein
LITMLFILLKLSSTTTLSWLWIIMALLLDLRVEIGEFLNPFFDPKNADNLPLSATQITTRRSDIQ